MKWGARAEALILDFFNDEHPQYRAEAWPALLQSEAFPNLLCSPDGLIRSEERDGPGIWEAKNFAIKATDRYIHQVRHGLAVTGFRWGMLYSPYQTPVQVEPWDPEFITDVLVPAVDDFMRWVKVGTFPVDWIDGNEDTTAALKAMNRETDGSTVALGADLLDTHRRLTELKQLLKEGEAEVDALSNRLRYAIGAADYGTLPDGTVYSYRQQTTTKYDVPDDVKARYARKVTYRVLKTVKAPK
jgi:hypothetical protein